MIGSVSTLPLSESAWSEDESLSDACRSLVLEQYDRESLPLLRFLLSIGTDSGLAEELVQESFLRLHQHLLGSKDRTNLRAWLYRVAHNLARNVQTSSASSRTGSLSLVVEKAEPQADGLSAEAALLARERNHRLNAALARLEGPQRDCILLRSQGLKYREIGDVLNLSTSTVAEHLRRGLENLKETV